MTLKKFFFFDSRSLRVQLQQESYEFIRQQRLMCLMQGAWFANGVPAPSSDFLHREHQLKRPVRPWRFYRLVCTELRVRTWASFFCILMLAVLRIAIQGVFITWIVL